MSTDILSESDFQRLSLRETKLSFALGMFVVNNVV